ncbi:hypothetical protein CRENBAI_026184 [Crenichthys baileyi]|uniref:Uncharacterized protein n=1 Tax=Crenichthys baileyi TaxID=28760 RepID=A0AAV9RCH4_9TELE
MLIGRLGYAQKSHWKVEAVKADYIMNYDLDAIYKGCLGSDDAGLALSLQPTCRSCWRFPLEEKQRRLAIFLLLDGEFPRSRALTDRSHQCATYAVTNNIAFLIYTIS